MKTKKSLQPSSRVAVLPCIQVLRPTEVPLVALIYFSWASFYSSFSLLMSLGFGQFQSFDLCCLYKNLSDF